MRVTVGSGDNRHTFERPLDKIEREKMAEDIKTFFRARAAR